MKVQNNTARATPGGANMFGLFLATKVLILFCRGYRLLTVFYGLRRSDVLGLKCVNLDMDAKQEIANSLDEKFKNMGTPLL